MLYRAIYTNIPLKYSDMQNLAYAIAILIGLYLIYKLCILAYTKHSPGAHPKLSEAHSTDDIEKLKEYMEKVFTRLNIEFQLYEDNEISHRYSFIYQDGTFLLDFALNSPKYLRLIYPNILQCNLDQIDLVRIICNNTNTNNIGVTAGYTIIPEENNIKTHLILSMSLPCSALHFEEMFKQAAYDCFALNNSIHRTYDSLLDDCTEYQVTDIEFTHRRDQAIQYLLEESLVKCTEETFFIPRIEPERPDSLTLLQFLTGACLLNDAQATELEVSGRELHLVLNNETDIYNYPIAAALTDKNGLTCVAATTFERTDAVISVKASRMVGESTQKLQKDICLYLMLHAEYQTDTTLYFRLTYCSPTRETERAFAAPELVQQSLRSTGSMLIGLDLKTDNEKLAEFNYLWAEAKEQTAQNKHNELSKEQILIAQIQNSDEAQNLYQGTRLMRERRFFEAAHYLEKAWNQANQNVLQNYNRNLPSFYEMSYLYGLCLYRLGNYKLAHFYLQQSNIEENLQHAKLWVNCNLKINYAGAIEEIKKLQHICTRQIEQEETENMHTTEGVVNFYHFLMRCEIHMLLNMNQLQKAEELCLRLLKTNVSAEFAQERLDLIKAMRQKAEREARQNERDVKHDTSHDETSTLPEGRDTV